MKGTDRRQLPPGSRQAFRRLLYRNRGWPYPKSSMPRPRNRARPRIPFLGGGGGFFDGGSAASVAQPAAGRMVCAAKGNQERIASPHEMRLRCPVHQLRLARLLFGTCLDKPRVSVLDGLSYSRAGVNHVSRSPDRLGGQPNSIARQTPARAAAGPLRADRLPTAHLARRQLLPLPARNRVRLAIHKYGRSFNRLRVRLLKLVRP